MGWKAGLSGDPLVSFVKAEQEKEPVKLVNVSFYCSMIVTAKQHNYLLQPKSKSLVVSCINVISVQIKWLHV